MTASSPRAPGADRICAVLVTYHPDGGLPSRLARTVSQVDLTVMVDNGSSPSEVDMLRHAAGSAATLISNGANLGIARALNIGIEHARAHGCSWALLLDQDTLPDPDLVARLRDVQASCADENVAVIGSRYRDTSGHTVEAIRVGTRQESCVDVQSVITSGCLMSLHAYGLLGPFRDDLFIDYVDTEYCYRARAAGFRVVQTRAALMSHTVGAASSHMLLGKKYWTTNHSAERRYYIARNNTFMLRKYRSFGRGPWLWRSFTRCLRLSKRILLFETDKLNKTAAVWQGWRDALRGRLGPRSGGTEGG